MSDCAECKKELEPYEHVVHVWRGDVNNCQLELVCEQCNDPRQEKRDQEVCES